MNMQPCSMIMWKIWKASLKQTIFQSLQKAFQIYPATYYRNTSFLFQYSRHVKSVLSFQYHPAQLHSVTAHSRSGKQQCVLSKIQGKRWGERKGIGRYISRCRFAWRLLTLGWVEQVMSWLWWQGEAACTWW